MDFIRPVGGRPSAFFLSFLNHLRAALCPPPRRSRTLLNCPPLVFTPVPLRYGLSSEEALRDIYSAARVARIKTARDQRKRKRERRKKKKKKDKTDAYLARRQAPSTCISPIILVWPILACSRSFTMIYLPRWQTARERRAQEEEEEEGTPTGEITNKRF